MPFIGQSQAGVWTVKTEVRLRQLAPRGDRRWWKRLAQFLFGRKVRFEVLETFGHRRDDVPPFDAPLPEDTVPRRTVSDLASVPSFLWGVIPSYGGHTMAALLHDTQCTAAEYGDLPPPGEPGTRRPMAERLALRRRADDLFRFVLIEESGSGPATGWLMWAAVRAFSSPASRLATAALLVLVGVEVVPLVLDAGWTGLAGAASTTDLGARVADWVGLASLAGLAIGLGLVSREDVSITPDPERLGGPLRAVRSMAGALVVVAVALVPIAVAALTSWVVSRLLSVLDFVVDLIRELLPGEDVPTRAPACRPAPVAPLSSGDPDRTVTAS